MEPTGLDRTIRIIERLFEAEDSQPCLGHLPPEELRLRIPLAIPDQGRDLNEVYDLAEQIVLNTPRTSSRRFFNQLFGGRLLPAVAGEMLAAALNTSMYTYKVAGIQVLIEQEVIDTLCRYVGFLPGEGVFCPGGSLSNLSAMIVARNRTDPPIRDGGVGNRRLVAYTSDQSHYSITKNAGIIGIGRDSVREVATDEAGRLIPSALDQRIREDRHEGQVPFFVNATAGTTVLGAFDPIEEIAEIASQYGCWLHVDGAFGGSLLLSSRYRGRLSGCHKADSFAWNIHKMMGVPVSSSAILLKECGQLGRNFSEEAGYLYQGDSESLNPGLRSIQCGRRNDAFKVWLAFQCLGREGYQRRVEKQFQLAQFAAEYVKADEKLDLVVEPESINVCFRVIGRSSRQVCRELDLLGEAKIGWGVFRGKEFIRLVCVDADLSYSDLEDLFQVTKEVAERVAVGA